MKENRVQYNENKQLQQKSPFKSQQKQHNSGRLSHTKKSKFSKLLFSNNPFNPWSKNKKKGRILNAITNNTNLYVYKQFLQKIILNKLYFSVWNKQFPKYLINLNNNSILLPFFTHVTIVLLLD